MRYHDLREAKSALASSRRKRKVIGYLGRQNLASLRDAHVEHTVRHLRKLGRLCEGTARANEGSRVRASRTSEELLESSLHKRSGASSEGLLHRHWLPETLYPNAEACTIKPNATPLIGSNTECWY